MRLSGTGGFIQMLSSSEGGILQELRLLQFTDSLSHVDVEPTYLLREMFATQPPLEELYPVLVEFVMRFRFPKMVDRADVEKRVRALGMAGDGLARLNLMLRQHYRIWDADF